MFFHKHGQISQQHKVDDQRQVSNLLLLPLYFSSFLATSRSNSIRVHCSSWTLDLFSSFVAVFGAVVRWRVGDQVLRVVLLEGTVMGKEDEQCFLFLKMIWGYGDWFGVGNGGWFSGVYLAGWLTLVWWGAWDWGCGSMVWICWDDAVLVLG